MEMIIERERIENTVYVLSFVYKDDPNAGFNFDCDAKGTYIQGGPEGHANYLSCLNGENNIEFEGIKEYDHSYTQCAVGRCNCGGEVHLDGFTNECEKCDTLYSQSGQMLRAREEWDEDDRYSCDGPQNGSDDY